MTQLVWVLFVDTRERKISEPLGSVDIEFGGFCRRLSTHRVRGKEQESDAHDEFHWLIIQFTIGNQSTAEEPTSNGGRLLSSSSLPRGARALTAAAARGYRLRIQQGALDCRVISVCGVRER